MQPCIIVLYNILEDISELKILPPIKYIKPK